MGKSISLKKTCARLDICEGTARNWARLGKLHPVSVCPLCFDEGEVRRLRERLLSGGDGALKSRRNKTKISGSRFCGDYIPGSVNAPVIRKMAELSDGKNLRAVLTNAALQLFTGRSGNLLQLFLGGELSVGEADGLLRELFGKSEEADGEIYGQTVRFVPFEDTLGWIYSSLSNIGSRKKGGVYYTPPSVARNAADELSRRFPLEGKSILDPCCGSGSFLLSVAERTLCPERLYGFDTDALAVAVARLNMVLNFPGRGTAFLYENLRVGNSLSVSEKRQFDAVVGNPPWGLRFSERQSRYNASHFVTAQKKSAESAAVFTEKALGLLKKDGFLAFVLPEAVLNAGVHAPLRRLLREQSFCHVAYLGTGFGEVSCPAVTLLLKKDGLGHSRCTVCRDGEKYTSLDIGCGGECLAFRLTERDAQLLSRMEGGDRVYLKNNAVFALGIVTGDNQSLLRREPFENAEPIYTGADVERYRLKNPSHYIEYRPDAFQQAARQELYRTSPKLFYRFIADSPVVAPDEGGSLSLNSCNILIPQLDGFCPEYIMAVLNSRAVRFYFQKKFASLKVLKSHLEAIPLPRADEAVQKRIKEKTDLLGKGEDEDLSGQLNEIIEGLYGLNGDDLLTEGQD